MLQRCKNAERMCWDGRGEESKTEEVDVPLKLEKGVMGSGCGGSPAQHGV